MSLDFIFSILPRPRLQPKDLVYRRRVAETAAGKQSNEVDDPDARENSPAENAAFTAARTSGKIDEKV